MLQTFWASKRIYVKGTLSKTVLLQMDQVSTVAEESRTYGK